MDNCTIVPDPKKWLQLLSIFFEFLLDSLTERIGVSGKNRRRRVKFFFFFVKEGKAKKVNVKEKKKKKENRKKRISGVKEFRGILFLFLVFLLYWRRDGLGDLEERYFKLFRFEAKFVYMRNLQRISTNFGAQRNRKNTVQVYFFSCTMGI